MNSWRCLFLICLKIKPHFRTELEKRNEPFKSDFYYFGNTRFCFGSVGRWRFVKLRLYISVTLHWPNQIISPLIKRASNELKPSRPWPANIFYLNPRNYQVWNFDFSPIATSCFMSFKDLLKQILLEIFGNVEKKEVPKDTTTEKPTLRPNTHLYPGYGLK